MNQQVPYTAMYTYILKTLLIWLSQGNGGTHMTHSSGLRPRSTCQALWACGNVYGLGLTTVVWQAGAIWCTRSAITIVAMIIVWFKFFYLKKVGTRKKFSTGLNFVPAVLVIILVPASILYLGYVINFN